MGYCKNASASMQQIVYSQFDDLWVSTAVIYSQKKSCICLYKFSTTYSKADLQPAFRVFCEACKGFLGVGPVVCWCLAVLEILLRHYIETPPGGARLARRRRDRRHRRRRGRQAAPAAGSFCAKRKPTYNVHTHMILQSADDGSAKLHNGRLVPFLNSSTFMF